MGCSACGRKQVTSVQATKAMSNLTAGINAANSVPGIYAGIWPMGATDIQVLDTKSNQIDNFGEKYWDKTLDHIIFFVPKINDDIKYLVDLAEKSSATADYVISTSQRADQIKTKVNTIVFSTRTLAQKLGLMTRDGTVKPAAVFFGADGTIIKHEHFDTSNRSDESFMLEVEKYQGKKE